MYNLQFKSCHHRTQWRTLSFKNSSIPLLPNASSNNQLNCSIFQSTEPFLENGPADHHAMKDLKEGRIKVQWERKAKRNRQ